MICPKCKKEIKDGSHFCGFCGNKFEVSSLSPQKEEKIVVVKKTEVVQQEPVEVESSTPSLMERIREENKKKYEALDREMKKPKKKDASVVGRGVAGALIGGPAGAVVGALSAIDKNNKNKD